MRRSIQRYRTHQGHVLWMSVLILVLFCSSCGVEGQTGNSTVVSGQTMGTTYAIKIRGVPETFDLELVQKRIDEILERINSRMSTYREDSELSLFNQSESTDWMPVSSETVHVVSEAVRISTLTNGAFDVTIGPLVNLWGFGPDSQPIRIPSEEAIREKLTSVGYQHLHLRNAPPAIRKDESRIQIDLSAIAKGYAVDQVVEFLESQNVLHFLVEVGGELRGKGLNSAGLPWKVAIEKPKSDERAIHQVLNLESQAMATSGDYRNFFHENGERFSHTINPQTGQPVTHQLASVTVLRTSCMEADALATGLMVLGPDAGLKLARQEKFPAFFVSRTKRGFEETMTPELESFL